MDKSKRRLAIASGLTLLTSLLSCTRQRPASRFTVGFLDMHAESDSKRIQQLLVNHIASHLRLAPAEVRMVANWAPRNAPFDADVKRILGENPDLVIAISSGAARAVRAADSRIPIVFAVYDDPWRNGLLEVPFRPSAAMTGLWNDLSLNCKRIELLVRAFPRTRHIAVLHDSDAFKLAAIRNELDACQLAGVKTTLVHVDSRKVLGNLKQLLPGSVDALAIPHSDVCNMWPEELVAGIGEFGRPAFFDGEFLVAMGALASVEPVQLDEPAVLSRLAASVLSGTSPADLPVERPKTTRVCLNLLTAKKMNLPLPGWLVRGADRIIS